MIFALYDAIFGKFRSNLGHMYNKKLHSIQYNILKATLKMVPFHGWSAQALENACAKLGYEPHSYQLYFEDGITSVVDKYLQDIDQMMIDEILKLPLESMKIRERILESVMIRLKIQEHNKIITSKTTAFLAMPQNLKFATQCAWRTVDIIWREAGKDTSTDYNYYTKRTLLAGVYTATLMYWLAENDDEKVRKFLTTQINMVIGIGKNLSKILPKFS